MLDNGASAMKLSPRQTRLLAGPLTLLLRSLGRTWRIQTSGPGQGRLDAGVIDTIWHGRALPYLYLRRFQNCVAMVSEHRDGQLIAEVIERLGGKTVRGSSTRGGARAYLSMLRHMQDLPWVITPDGPRGPRGVAQEGVIKLASDTGRIIQPHGFACVAARELNSWDRFMIPRPFTRISWYRGEPLPVPRELSRAHRRVLAEELRRRIDAAQQQADRLLRPHRHSTTRASAKPAMERAGDQDGSVGTV